MKEILKEIKVELSGNTEKIIILYAKKCEFCKEYLDNLDKMNIVGSKKQSIKYGKYIVDETKGRIIGVMLKINKLPATVFINDKNKVRAVVFGVLSYEKIQQIISERMREE